MLNPPAPIKSFLGSWVTSPNLKIFETGLILVVEFHPRSAITIIQNADFWLGGGGRGRGYAPHILKYKSASKKVPWKLLKKKKERWVESSLDHNGRYK